MSKTKVFELKNFEGYEFHCNCCGKEIIHPYAIYNTIGVFGKDCVKKIYGNNIDKKTFNTKGNTKDSLDAFMQNNGIKF